MDYKQLFDLFVKKDPCTVSEWMTKPFLNEMDGNVWATDGAAAVIVPMDIADLQYDKLEKKLAMPVELDTDKQLHFFADRIRQAVEKCPKEEIMEEKEEKCKECDGTGKVLWEYKATTNNDFYDQEHDCPICDGVGSTYEEVGTGRFQPARKSGVRMGEAVFSAWQLDRVLKTMALLGFDELTVTSEPHRSRATLFRLGDIKIVQMPMYMDDMKEKIIEL